MITDELKEIRTPGPPVGSRAVLFTALAFLAGGTLGIFSKWLDELALDSSVWWHVILERLDLNNFFSNLAIWLLAALLIAVYSSSALRAWNVRIDEIFFLGGMDKSEILEAFGANIFFDDQKVHTDRARKYVPSARVPYRQG